MLQAKDSALKTKLMNLVERQNIINIPISSVEEQKYKVIIGFHLLGDLATNAIPALVDICTNSPSPTSKECADVVLMITYPVSDSAIPYWLPPRQRAEWCFEAGETKSRWDTQSNAILAFSESIKLDPTNASPYLNRASVKIQLRDFAGALGDAKRSIELDSNNQIAFYSSGLCQFALKDFKDAEADFTTAINLYTNDINAYNYRGLARANLRKLDEALADFNQAVELARPISKRLKIKVRLDLCERVRATEVQSKLDAAERRKNLRDAFAVTGSVDGLHIAVLDDVVTTGTTLQVLTEALKDAGARRVTVWSVCRAASPS